MKIKNSETCAFTIIELLVSIAIISVLVSLSLNTYVNARRKAVKTNCMSNLKEIGVAWHLYTIDFDRFPTGDDIEVGEDPTFTYGGWQGVVISVPPEKRPLNNYVSKGSLTQSGARIFHCPGDKDPQAFIRTVFKTTGNSYPSNLFSGAWDALGGLTPDGPNVSRSLLILAGDAGWLFDAQDDASNAHFHQINRKAVYNVLFLDFHVDTIRMNKGQLSGEGWTVDAIQ
ncbi:type II secretion system protein [Chlamydiota bacterium]